MAKRKANGEGTIFMRKDGRWAAQASITQADGEPKRICFTSKDRETAKEKLRVVLEQNDRLPHSGKEWNVADYLDYWLNDIQSKRRRESTMVAYRGMINNWIKPVLGKHSLRELNVSDVDLALDYLRERGCKSSALQKCLGILSSCLSYAMRKDLIYRNVAKLADKPEHTPKETVIWTVEQAIHFLQSTKESPHYIAYLLLLTYGMRRGETLGIRWCDIDFISNQIHLRQQIDRIDNKIMARDLKTKNSRRTLPLISSVRDELLKLAQKRDITIPPFNPVLELSPEGTIVSTHLGTPLESSNFVRYFQAETAKAGLPRIKVHALRHTAATILKDLNVPIKDVQMILGHAHISTTLAIYQHGTSETQRTAMNTLGERLLGKTVQASEILTAVDSGAATNMLTYST
jgi:integrase